MSASPPASPPPVPAPESPAPLAGLGFTQNVIPSSPPAVSRGADGPSEAGAAAAPASESAAAAPSTSASPAARLAPAAEILSPPAPPLLSRFSSSYSSYSALSAGSTSAAAAAPVILGLAVVDFNHLVGPQVEFTVPEALAEDADILASLPFLALPDGSHLSDEDFCHFHLLAPALHPHTIFGISCNRQIASSLLTHKGKEVTRGTVQKAVVVLAREPVFGPIREKLGIVTRAFFAQGDLSDKHILEDFWGTLEEGLGAWRRSPLLAAGSDSGAPEDAGEREREKEREKEREAEWEGNMYMGTSLRELVYKWRFKTLMLLKLLLLQRKIMFFGYPVERLCTYQYSLVSMVPNLLLNLADAGSPVLDSSNGRRNKAESLKTSDKKSMLRFMGLPLNLFGNGAFFQPYLPLQQIDLASSAKSFLVGTTNSIFKQQKECGTDVIVDLEHTSLEFVGADPKLQAAINLTPADRKWMDELVNVVTETWNVDDPTRPSTMQYVGSDDYLRSKFEDYICSMLSTVKYTDFLTKGEKSDLSIYAPDAAAAAAFGTDFLAAFKRTAAYEIWDDATDPMVFDLFEHKHPCEGKVSALEDVGLRVTAGLHDLHLEEQLAPTREAIGAALTSGSATAWKFANKLGSDLARIRREQLAKAEAAAAAKTGSSGLTNGSSGAGVEGGSSDGTTPRSSQSASSGPTAADLQAQASAAAAQASTQVRAAFGSFGSFLASKRSAWGAAASPAAATAPAAAAAEPATSLATARTLRSGPMARRVSGQDSPAASPGGASGATLVAGRRTPRTSNSALPGARMSLLINDPDSPAARRDAAKAAAALQAVANGGVAAPSSPLLAGSASPNMRPSSGVYPPSSPALRPGALSSSPGRSGRSPSPGLGVDLLSNPPQPASPRSLRDGWSAPPSPSIPEEKESQ